MIPIAKFIFIYAQQIKEKKPPISPFLALLMSPVENKKSWKDIHSGFNSIQIDISLIKQMYHSPIDRLYNLHT